MQKAAQTRPTRPRGRPMKFPSNISALEPQDAKIERPQKKPRSLRHLKSRRKMSLLEKLPSELLQEVFLFAKNLNLPRASPILAGKLSAKYTYMRTIVEAFHEAWAPQYEWIKYDAQLVDGHGSPPPLAEGDPKLQAAVLRCRWINFELFKKAQDEWLRRAAIGRDDPPEIPHHVLEVHEKDLPSEKLLTHYMTSHGLEETEAEAFRKAWHPRKLLYRHSVADDLFEPDYEDFRNLVDNLNWEQSPIVSWFESRWHWQEPYFKVHEGFEIPAYLLHGPWSDDNLKFLFYLARSLAQVDWFDSTSGEEAVAGLYTAIRTGNLYALFVLSRFCDEKHVSVALIKYAIWNATLHREEIMKFFKPLVQDLGHRDRVEVRKEITRFRTEVSAEGDDGERERLVQVTKSVWEIP